MQKSKLLFYLILITTPLSGGGFSRYLKKTKSIPFKKKAAITTIGTGGALGLKYYFDQKNQSFLSTTLENINQIRSPQQLDNETGCGYYAYKNTAELIKALEQKKLNEFLKTRRKKHRSIEPYHGLKKRGQITFDELRKHQKEHKDTSHLQNICMTNISYYKPEYTNDNARLYKKITDLHKGKIEQLGIVLDAGGHRMSFVAHKPKNKKISFYFQDSLNRRLIPYKIIKTKGRNEFHVSTKFKIAKWLEEKKASPAIVAFFFDKPSRSDSRYTLFVDAMKGFIEEPDLVKQIAIEELEQNAYKNRGLLDRYLGTEYWKDDFNKSLKKYNLSK